MPANTGQVSFGTPPWGEGRPVSEATRRWFESPPGAGLDGVRIHDGPAPARWARMLGARAFTIGNDVVFGAGEYAPHTATGRRLLGHELAHVIEQRAQAGRPLLARAALPNADLDTIADQLFQAMKGLGTDEEAVYVGLQKLGRDAAAIQALRAAYKRLHGTDLESDIRSEMSGSELDFALDLLGIAPSPGSAILTQPPGTSAEYDAVASRIHAAIAGLGTDEEAIYAALLPLARDASRAATLKATYQRLFHVALEDDLHDDLSGDELAYALYLLNAPGPAAPRGAAFTVTGPGTAPQSAPPPVAGGAVSVGTEVPYTTAAGKSASFSFGVTYKGGLAAESRWLQLIWRDIIATDANGAVRALADNVTVGNVTYPLTTSPRSPNYRVDSRSTSSPFYEDSSATAPRTADATTVLDAPSPIVSLVESAFKAGAVKVVSAAHFDLYLIRDYKTLYHVHIDVIHTFTSPASRRTDRVVSATETVDRLPAPVRDVLVRDYPAFEYIR